MFKIGDHIIWIVKGSSVPRLCEMTYGKTYKVIELGLEDVVWIYNDNGFRECWVSQRFILDIKYVRKKKLQRCLK